ncbi:hypothetical protein HYU19_01355 [Candidatus Woesearchaeota archaeon]|nr:hypothetical protein [Candidatus Woesearchaeota archaeon]
MRFLADAAIVISCLVVLLAFASCAPAGKASSPFPSPCLDHLDGSVTYTYPDDTAEMFQSSCIDGMIEEYSCDDGQYLHVQAEAC